MSLGFSGGQNRFVPKPKPNTPILPIAPVPPPEPKIEKIDKVDKVVVREVSKPINIIKLPSWSNILYTLSYMIVVIVGVSSLWISAIGLFWIKYYIECNKGILSC
tara:strand:- start:128 stop:442 length:315 start_codon:yes stop_codon:yes gene_type:complete